MANKFILTIAALFTVSSTALAAEKEHLAIRSIAQIAGHPIHPMIVVFPLGLLITSLVLDIIYFVRKEPIWCNAAYYLIWGGVIGGIVAAIPGFIDYLIAIPRNLDAHQDATIHWTVNAGALVLFIINLGIRRKARVPSRVAAILSVAGVMILAVGGWFGGELVFEHGIGVSPEHVHEVIEEHGHSALPRLSP